MLLFIFLLSILVRKYKLRTWKVEIVEFEFSSLFRRFLAKSLDFLIIMIPAFIPFVFRNELFFENPFKLVGLFFTYLA